ncbi:MAG: hypothetical protein Q7U63_01105 [Polaromonas sp.]|uniref:hypothetical protein n=1 Tax=Polaromonas sp. TaxID=1869339 RepID=UPI0027225D2A|nr:hypothetical protein [Polaromonas sp.]MDO9112373.1 hypothetical protein [Polaromonas sp.]MDP1885884.1 hypothetical protein [Polaromonas sp.]
MFSTHMPPVNTVPREYLYLGAGALLMVSLLAAMAMVAGGEVKKAKARDSLLASQQTAVAYCVETLRGAALSNCMRHARADMYNDGAKSPLAGNEPAGAVMAGGQSKAPADNMGMIPVSFSAVR